MWGLVTAVYGTLAWLAAIGLDDKYIQQDHPDQQEAFEVAFTLQCALCAAFTVLSLAGHPAVRRRLRPVGDDRAGPRPGRRVPRVRAPDTAVGVRPPARVPEAAAAPDLGPGRVVRVSPCRSRPAGPASGRPWPARSPGCGWPPRSRCAPRRTGSALRRSALGFAREYASFSWPLFLASAAAVTAGQVPLLVASRRARAGRGRSDHARDDDRPVRLPRGRGAHPVPLSGHRAGSRTISTPCGGRSRCRTGSRCCGRSPLAAGAVLFAERPRGPRARRRVVASRST